MIDQLLGIVAPHHCYGCGKMGQVLCDNCIFDIKNEPFERCVACLSPTSGNLCLSHRLPYSRVWCAGEREGALEATIDGYKFMRMRSAGFSLAELLDGVVPQLPAQTVVTAVPSIAPHIRQRGYDHATVLAQAFARKRNLAYDQVLFRRGKTAQRGATRKTRIAQAKEAFTVSGGIRRSVPYLLIDDVLTTGATVRYAAQALRYAGASEVWVAVLARQVSTEGF